MEVTVEKALELFCPFRATDNKQDKKCLGNRCMAWKFIEEYIPPPPQPNKGFPCPIVSGTSRTTDIGYCGLTRR